MGYFKDFDFTNFWQPDEADCEREEYPGDEAMKDIENQLGFKLPESYLWLMRQHNGGAVLQNTEGLAELFAVQSLCNADDVLEYSVEKDYSKIGILFAAPRYGPDFFIFDYRTCTKNEEPSIAYLNMETDYHGFEITQLGNNFEEFITSLVFGKGPEIPGSADGKEEYRQLLDTISFLLMCVLFFGGFILQFLKPNWGSAPILGGVFAWITGIIWVTIDEKLKKCGSKIFQN